MQNIQRQIRMANKPKKIQPGQGGKSKDSFYSRGSSNVTRTDNASVISQVLEQNQVSRKHNDSGELPGNRSQPEDSFVYDPSPKNTASEMEGYPNTLDYAGSELKSSKKNSNKGTIINKHNHNSEQKSCCKPCAIF